VFPLGPARFDDGTLVLYLIGAFLSIIAGNALAVVTGLSGRALGLPRWLAIAGLALGGIGLLNIPLTYGWTPTGLAERTSTATCSGLCSPASNSSDPRGAQSEGGWPPE
jgi:hypothetical protein